MKTKKRCAVLLVLTILFIAVLVFAQNETTSEEGSELAYSYLEEQLGDNCGNTQNTEQASFNLLAMAYDSSIKSDCESSIKDKKNEECWGTTKSSGCNIKSTAIASIALDHIGEDVDDSIEWLLEQRKLAKGLTWYLEIDANNKTECDINGNKITIESDKKISGINPAGLKKAYDNYWFEITDLSKNFTISCDKNFITTLLYQKPGKSVYYVSSETHSAAAGDSITEKVEAYCFTTSTTCDYEGTLWATIALAKLGESVSLYLPYISAMADETANAKYLPMSFLYMLTGSDDYYSGLVTQQKQNKYWEESGNKLYDTALAMLALGSADSANNARDYLLSIQNPDGGWQSDTAFILYAGWPKTPYSSSATGGGTTVSDCEDSGYYCVEAVECGLENQLDEYCSGLRVCCTQEPQEETCEEKQGVICKSGEQCSVTEVITSDTNYCCRGECQVPELENECEKSGYFCKNECFESQEKKEAYSAYCGIGQICCGDKTSPDEKSLWWLIILLIILIILVIIAIIFRKRLKLWLFKSKSNFRFGKAQRPGAKPGFPPPGFTPGFRQPIMRPGRMPPRQPIQRPVGRPPARTTTRDQDFDETMKKLKDMSK